MIIVLIILMIIFFGAIIGFFMVSSSMRAKFKKAHPNVYCEKYDYTRNDFSSVLKTVLVNYWIYGLRLTVKMRYAEKICVVDLRRETRRELIREEYWTNESSANIHLDGFRKVKGLHDGLLWLFVPVYLRIENASYFQVPDTKTNGKYDYPQDTAETLHDYASSNATQKFIAAMSKASLDNLDTHTIIMIAILAVGAIFGMHLFGVF